MAGAQVTRRAWTPPTVRRFSAGCAETDLVVVGTSVLIREDVPTWAAALKAVGFEPVVQAAPVRGFAPWAHEPDEFDRQAEEDLAPDVLDDDWQDHCGDPDCDICGEPPMFDGHL